MIKSCMKKNVFSIQANATLREAAKKMAGHHIGLLPVVDQENKVIGIIGLPDMLALEMPAFFNLMNDLDFMADFGAVEVTRPSAQEVDQPVTAIMQPVLSVEEDSGLLLAYGLMLKHNLSDLPVVDESEHLVGIVSRVDIGTTILATWQNIEEDKP